MRLRRVAGKAQAQDDSVPGRQASRGRGAGPPARGCGSRVPSAQGPQCLGSLSSHRCDLRSPSSEPSPGRQRRAGTVPEFLGSSARRPQGVSAWHPAVQQSQQSLCVKPLRDAAVGAVGPQIARFCYL